MPNANVNKVVLGSETLLDLTADTATAEDVAEGKTFHLASGAQAIGTATGGSMVGAPTFYGTCATAAATAAKVVVCEEFTSDYLVEGTVINVKFTNAQTYNGAPTLNVQSTGAKNIKRVGTTNAARYEWLAGEVLQFVYDGSYWMLTDGGIATTTYYGVTKLATSAVSTNTATALTPASLNSFAQNMVSGYPAFSTSSTYAVGDRVRYGYYTYECIKAIITAGAWDASEWTALDSLQEQVDTKQDALVSGTNIRTVNSVPLLGSGNVPVGTASYTTQAVTLSTTGWYNNQKSVSVTGMTASKDVIVSPAPASIDAYAAAGVCCAAQGSGTLTFRCKTVPTAALTVNVMTFEKVEMTYPITVTGGEDVVTVSSVTRSPVTSAPAGIVIYVDNRGINDYTVTVPGTELAGGAPLLAGISQEFTMLDSDVTVICTPL